MNKEANKSSYDSSTTPILEMKGVNKLFKNDLLKKNRLALDDVNCSFQKGKCTGLLGHNGAGKTTTIRVILGIIFADKGDILFKGTPINNKSKYYIGYMPETNKLPLNQTPLEILWSHLKIFSNGQMPNKEIESRCQESLRQIGLWVHRDKRVKNLSKGMGRRLAWGQATIHKPELLILDEPFSGMDPLGRQEMKEWIDNAKHNGTTIILCTHELWAVHALCDHVQIMNKGQVVYSSLSDKTKDDNEVTNYELQISGTTEEVLKELKEKKSLPEWDSVIQEGWLSKLNFKNYESAVSWFSACIENGYLILNFANTGSTSDVDLLKYFKGGAN